MSDHPRAFQLRRTVQIALACFVLAAGFYLGPGAPTPARGAPATPDGEILGSPQISSRLTIPRISGT